jgi:hypothetical protein
MILDMKTITKGKTPFLAIPVPKEAFYFDWKWSAREEHIIIYWETEDGWVQGIKTDFKSEFHFEILNKFSELCEMECDEFVETIHIELMPSPANDMGGSWDTGYVDYENIGEYAGWQGDAGAFRKAKESFQSLLNSEGFDNNTLIVKIL